MMEAANSNKFFSDAVSDLLDKYEHVIERKSINMALYLHERQTTNYPLEKAFHRKRHFEERVT